MNLYGNKKKFIKPYLADLDKELKQMDWRQTDPEQGKGHNNSSEETSTHVS